MPVSLVLAVSCRLWRTRIKSLATALLHRMFFGNGAAQHTELPIVEAGRHRTKSAIYHKERGQFPLLLLLFLLILHQYHLLSSNLSWLFQNQLDKR